MALLETLLRMDNRAYISFYNALVKEAYDDLANLLHEHLPHMSPDAHKSSSDSCTPYGEKGVAWVFSPVEVWRLCCQRVGVLECWRKLHVQLAVCAILVRHVGLLQ